MTSEREPRRPFALAAQLVLPNDEVIDVQLVDLSSHGCKVRSPKILWIDDRLSLSIPGKGAIGCTVRWSRDGLLGLQFDPETDAAPGKSDVPRSHVRVSMSADVRLRRIGGPNFTVTLRDISLDGCKVDMVERPRVGEALQVIVPGLATLDARVRWLDGFVAGLEFDQPFHPAVFDMLVERLTGKRP